MAYKRNIPQSGTLLSSSQPDILENFNASDDVFDIDHYAFSNNSTPGLHRYVTSVAQASHPASPTTQPIIYGKDESGTNLGVLQYSKGPNRVAEGNQVSTPLTFIQSPETPIILTAAGLTDIFDFTGITRAFMKLFIANVENGNRYLTTSDIWFLNDGGTPIFKRNSSGDSASLTPVSTNFILQGQNNTGSNMSNIYWTLQFIRIQI